MRAYTTLDGEMLDLSTLTDEEVAYFDRCYAAYRDGVAFFTFQDLVTGFQNPLLRDTEGRVTDVVWAHPLFRALRDLEDRLGIGQGELGPDPDDDIGSDPLALVRPRSAGQARRTG